MQMPRIHRLTSSLTTRKNSFSKHWRQHSVCLLSLCIHRLFFHFKNSLQKIDTLFNGIHDSIYVYSTDPVNAKYSLAFASVGVNKGNYIPLFNAANGQVFQWVQPINGIRQGNYEPATFLVTPKKQQVMTVGATYLADKKELW